MASGFSIRLTLARPWEWLEMRPALRRIARRVASPRTSSKEATVEASRTAPWSWGRSSGSNPCFIVMRRCYLQITMSSKGSDRAVSQSAVSRR